MSFETLPFISYNLKYYYLSLLYSTSLPHISLFSNRKCDEMANNICLFTSKLVGKGREVSMFKT
jgi:hypothetical protein